MTEEMSINEYLQMRNDLKSKRFKGNKFHNVKTIIDGITFDSLKEGRRYQELKILQRSGAICEMEIQKRFELNVNAQKICDYVCDFFYFDKEKEEWIVEDVKSSATRTPVYRIKKKLMAACLGIEIKEV